MVRGSDFAQAGAARFENLRDAKPAPDLDELSARNNHFVFRRGGLGFTAGLLSLRCGCGDFAEMPQDQDQSPRVVIDRHGGFGATEEREAALQIGSARTTLAGGQIVFQVVVVRADLGEPLNGLGREGRATEVCVDQDSRPVDDGLDSRGTQIPDSHANAREHRTKLRNIFLLTKRAEFAAHDIKHDRAGKCGLAECLCDFFDRGNPAQFGVFHAETRILAWRERTIRPMGAAQMVRPASRLRVAFKCFSGTHSSKPPLVCASVKNVFCPLEAPSHSVN